MHLDEFANKAYMRIEYYFKYIVYEMPLRKQNLNW